MSKYLFAVVAMATVLAQPALAAMDCGANLDKHSVMITKMTAAPAEKRAAMHRMNVQAYDHCMAGDEFNATAFWKMVADSSPK